MTPTVKAFHAMINGISIAKAAKNLSSNNIFQLSFVQLLWSHKEWTFMKHHFSCQHNPIDCWWWLMHNSSNLGCHLKAIDFVHGEGPFNNRTQNELSWLPQVIFCDFNAMTWPLTVKSQRSMMTTMHGWWWWHAHAIAQHLRCSSEVRKAKKHLVTGLYRGPTLVIIDWYEGDSRLTRCILIGQAFNFCKKTVLITKGCSRLWKVWGRRLISQPQLLTILSQIHKT